MVSNLISSEDHCWNLPLLNDLFNSESIEAIQKIHIPLRGRADKLIWVLDSKGAFSVKFAYKANQDPPCGSSIVQWKEIWKIKAHDRIKMLLWRIRSNVLPIKNNLAIRIGTFDPNCVFCGKEPETASHIFFHCQVARAIWFDCSWGIRTDKMNIASNEDILKVVLNMDELCTLQMAVTMEAIWHLRNQVLHNGNEVNIISTICNAKNRVKEYLIALDHEQDKDRSVKLTSWIPPPKNYIKLNVDVAVSQAFTSLAVVARNEFGEVLKVWAKIHDLCTPTQAEATAIMWALNLAAAENWCNIIVEGDLKICFDALSKAEEPSDWSISSIIHNAAGMSVSFDKCEFCWVKRSLNSAAHLAAEYAVSLKVGFLCNNYDLPPPILNACRQDCCSSCVSS